MDRLGHAAYVKVREDWATGLPWYFKHRAASHLAMDTFKDAGGVFGIYGHEDAAHITYLGLYALQHRGQDSTGIAVANDGRIRLSRAMGHVSDVFNERVLAGLLGRAAIGHVRHSTSGDSRVINAQPLLIEGACVGCC